MNVLLGGLLLLRLQVSPLPPHQALHGQQDRGTLWGMRPSTPVCA